jgi:hypothetical protein
MFLSYLDPGGLVSIILASGVLPRGTNLLAQLAGGMDPGASISPAGPRTL